MRSSRIYGYPKTIRNDYPVFSFDAKDEKGRIKGIQISEFSSETKEGEFLYSVATQPTRNGEKYQSETEKHFRTKEERQEYIKKAIKNAKKRAESHS